tara:strand:- start:142 stop:261 length:120 start_codon:yes stop_codon:yes gene_type:complete
MFYKIINKVMKELFIEITKSIKQLFIVLFEEIKELVQHK